MMDTLLFGTLAVHVGFGVLALASGAGAILTRKGGRRHLASGRLYVVAMAVVAVTAVPLAVAVANWFLLAITVFSGYLVFTGYRVLSRKRPKPGVASPVDWLGHGTMGVVGAGMIVVGAWDLVASVSGQGPILLVFGTIGTGLAAREIRSIRNPPADRMAWFYRHIVFMGGGYIATVTASITVNLTMVPPLVRWLGPTAVGVPLILYAVRAYEKRFDGTGQTAGA